ncbi:MAG: hypothetical protein HQ521_18110, partial [Bacteroidetes bacterium]|nr:hypothetical protein [Bacteroidota bacterium]
MRLKISLFIFSIFSVFSLVVHSQNLDVLNNVNVELSLPNIVVRNVKQDILITLLNKEIADSLNYKHVDVLVSGNTISAQIKDGLITLPYSFDEKEILTISIGNFTHSEPVNPIPLWMSILPPLIAIFIALIIREVYTALFTGIWVGTTIIYYYKGSVIIVAIFKGFLAILDT